MLLKVGDPSRKKLYRPLSGRHSAIGAKNGVGWCQLAGTILRESRRRVDLQPQPAEFRDEPFIWATWLTKLISDEAQCEWALWFRARHTFIKLPSGADLNAWTKEHDALVQWRAGKLREVGLKPRIEQSFTINGRTATIKGKADIIYEDDGVIWIEECKTGKKRDSDLVQALI